jgi:hypothetical protein
MVTDDFGRAPTAIHHKINDAPETRSDRQFSLDQDHYVGAGRQPALNSQANRRKRV